MAYDLQVGQLFDPAINTEDEVLGYMKMAQKLVLEGKTVMAWGGEGDNSNLQFTIPIPYLLSECRYFLKRVNPLAYGYIVNSARQIRF